METKDMLIRWEEQERERIERACREVSADDFEQALREEGGKGLRSRIYAKIYPELKTFFEEKQPRYYRILSAKATHYKDREENGLFVFLRPDFYKEEQFCDYMGVFSLDDFLQYVADDKIIPLAGRPILYQDNPLYADLFSKWERWRAEERIGFDYPPYANVLEEALSRPEEGFDLYKRRISEELARDFPHLKTIEKKALEGVGALPEVRPIEYFSERFAWLSLIHADPTVEHVRELLKEYEKHSEREEALELAIMYTFYAHQLFSAFIFYSKGSPVVWAPNDVRNSAQIFAKVIRQKPDLLSTSPLLYLANLVASRFRDRRPYDEYIPKVDLPVASNMEEAKQIYRKGKEEASIREGVTEATKKMGAVFGKMEASKQEDVTETIGNDIEDLRKAYSKLSEAYQDKLGRTVKRVATGVLLAAEIPLVAFEVLHGNLPMIVLEHLLFEGVDEAVAKPLVNRWFTEPWFRKTISGGVLGDLAIPVDVWQLGIPDPIHKMLPLT